ncbi:hypothetical protein JK182_01960 [Acetobacter okinawensis]|uniref:hypothetical protein n=1 Tax=Acetobacter okinawensis TaxID=1076594 RepID=UPI001BAACA77|nr:hypothetical protein [Acetobacter okinawensis]MBS0987459.1 hypothetical protein [Acetobacter okinawensis]
MVFIIADWHQAGQLGTKGHTMLAAKRQNFAEQFPSLFSAQHTQQKTDRLLNALNAIMDGLEAGSIRNVEYASAKSYINSAVAEGWDNIQKLYLSAYRNDPENTWSLKARAASSLYYAGVSALHNVLSLRKKITTAEKADLSGTAYAPFLNAANLFEHELIGLATTVRDLKQCVVKGRLPRPEPTPKNPNQVRGTCPCCFAQQAVRSASMVHHGYQRPGDGFQTSSCPGIRFKPFERSPDGTQYMIDLQISRIERDQAALANKDAWTEITKLENVRVSTEYPNGYKLVTYYPSDKLWSRAVKKHAAELEQSIMTSKSNLEVFEKRKSTWTLAPLRKADGTTLPLDYNG